VAVRNGHAPRTPDDQDPGGTLERSPLASAGVTASSFPLRKPQVTVSALGLRLAAGVEDAEKARAQLVEPQSV
jgi:hypothetical protein